MGQEDSLEKEMAIHSSILAWEIPWTEEPGRLQFMGSQRVRCNLRTKQQQLDHDLDNVKAKFEASDFRQTDCRCKVGKSLCHPKLSCHFSASPGRDSLFNVPFPFVVFWRAQWRAVGSTCCNNCKKDVCDHRQTS